MRDYKVKLCTFLGRQKNIQILHKYIWQGLKEGIIDEYHLFDFARNNGDHDFICDEFDILKKEFDGKIYLHYAIETKERLEKKEFGVDWKLFYSTLPLISDDNSIIIKCDDDILFIDLDGLRLACDARWEDKESFLIHSNCVNNGVCSYYYRHKFPEIQKELEEFPVGGLLGPIFTSPTLAAVMHSLFVSKMHTNLKKEGIHSNINYYREMDTFFYHRISINFIMMLGSDVKYIYEVSKNDEYELSCYLPEKLGRPNRIKGDFITSHYSYGMQEKVLLNRKDLMNLYDVMVKKYLEERQVGLQKRILTKWFPPIPRKSFIKTFKFPMTINNWWKTNSYYICTSDEKYYLTSHFDEDILKVVPSSEKEKSIFSVDYLSWEKGELTEDTQSSEKVRIKLGLFYITQYSYIGHFRNERIFITTSKIDEEKDIYFDFQLENVSINIDTASDDSSLEESFLIRFRKKNSKDLSKGSSKDSSNLYLNLNDKNDGIEVSSRKKTWWKTKRPFWANSKTIEVIRFEKDRMFYYKNINTNEIHRPYYMGWGVEL